MFKFRKSIHDNIQDFEVEYASAQYISTQYLTLWFKSIFETPEYKTAFNDIEKMYKLMAIEVVKYLSGQDPNIDSWNKEEYSQEAYLLAKKNAEKWADDVMNQDRDFCELRVQTLRLDYIYSRYSQGDDYLATDKAKRIQSLILKYGSFIPEEPNPKQYSKIIKKWILWSKQNPWE